MSDSRTAVGKPGGVTTLTPAAFLKRKMALSGLNATALAKGLGVHVQTVYNVTTGNRPISPSLALKLSKRFVEPVDVWLSPEIEISTSDLTDMALTAKRAKQRSGRVDGEQSLPLFRDGAPTVQNVDRILVDREIEQLLEITRRSGQRRALQSRAGPARVLRSYRRDHHRTRLSRTQ